MKLDVDALWARSIGSGVNETVDNYTRLLIEECAKACDAEKMPRAWKDTEEAHNDACNDCAAAIRALKPQQEG